MDSIWEEITRCLADSVGELDRLAEQMQFLVENECDIIQGFFIRGPLPENKMVLQFHKTDPDKIFIK